MNIKNAVDQTTTISDLWHLAERIDIDRDVHLTRWSGSEYVTVPGYEGTLNIDDLAVRLDTLLWRNREFAESERLPGKNLTIHINLIYKKSRSLYDSKNILERVVIIFRRLIGFMFDRNTTRFNPSDCSCFAMYKNNDPYLKFYGDYLLNKSTDITFGNWREFGLYTRTQFETTFRYTPPNDRIEPASIKSPPRWSHPQYWARA
jgi:hypothetical protein